MKIYTKTIIFAIVMLSIAPVTAQVVIFPASGTMEQTVPDVLSVSLQNTSAEEISGVLDFKIYKNNTLQISGTTKSFTLPAQGNLSLNRINRNELLLPLNLSFSDNRIAETVNNGYVLPDGNYRVCLKFIAGRDVLSDENCSNKIIGLPGVSNRIFLLYPADESEPASMYPIFSWSNVGRNIFYEIRIAEVLPHQLPVKGAAINNPPFHSENGLTSVNYIYPISAPALDSCKAYEWRITAYREQTVMQDIGNRTNREILAQSTVFRIKLDCPPDALRPNITDNYFDLAKATASYVYPLNNSMIAFKYNEKYKTDKVKLEIKDRTGTALLSIADFPETGSLKTGPNYLAVDATTHPELSGYYTAGNGEVLFLELTNKKGETWKAKFKFQ